MTDGVLNPKPVSQALGAEIEGVDIGRALTEPDDSAFWRAVHKAYFEHKALFFRDQDLTPDELVAFASRFGPIGIYPFAKPIPENPQVIAVVKEPHQTTNFGGMWHTDSPYLPKPSAATVLYAVEVPKTGGDTYWADMELALEALPGDIRGKVEGRTAVHSAANNKSVLRAAPLSEGAMEGRNESAMDVLEAVHPLVRTHPVTGAKSLYLSPAHTTRIEGVDGAESEALLGALFNHATDDRFTCRFHWRVGTLAIWDNRCTIHHPLNDYNGSRRAMHRVTIL